MGRAPHGPLGALSHSTSFRSAEKNGWSQRAGRNLVPHIEGAANNLKQIYDDMARDLGYSGAARSDGEGKLLEELLS